VFEDEYDYVNFLHVIIFKKQFINLKTGITEQTFSGLRTYSRTITIPDDIPLSSIDIEPRIKLVIEQLEGFKVDKSYGHTYTIMYTQNEVIGHRMFEIYNENTLCSVEIQIYDRFQGLDLCKYLFAYSIFLNTSIIKDINYIAIQVGTKYPESANRCYNKALVANGFYYKHMYKNDPGNKYDTIEDANKHNHSYIASKKTLDEFLFDNKYKYVLEDREFFVTGTIENYRDSINIISPEVLENLKIPIKYIIKQTKDYNITVFCDNIYIPQIYSNTIINKIEPTRQHFICKLLHGKEDKIHYTKKDILYFVIHNKKISVAGHYVYPYNKIKFLGTHENIEKCKDTIVTELDSIVYGKYGKHVKLD